MDALHDSAGRSASPLNPSGAVRFGHYAVCFYDLLSQRSLLEALRKLPSTPEETTAFVAAAKKTAGTVIEVRSVLMDFVRSFSTPDPSLRAPLHATAEEAANFARHRQSLLQTQCFADTCLLYYAFPDEVSVGLKSLYGLLIGVGLTHLMLLSAGVAGRGSVEVDIGTDALPGEVYGPVLARAYHLEAEVAKYPRIVVGPGFDEFVQQLRLRSDDTPEARYSRAMSEHLSSLVTRDVDEQLMVHFLGPAFRQVAASVRLPFGELAQKAHAFVTDALQKQRAAGDEKLSARYQQLHVYFEQNIHRWATVATNATS